MFRAALFTFVTMFAITLWPQTSDRTPRRSGRGPVIVIERQVVDIGLVHQGNEITTVFNLKNNGAQDLLISELQPSCGCTVLSFERILKPGETGSIKISLDRRGLSGVFDKEIGFISNDPLHPRLKLTIRGKFEPSVSVKPDDFVHIDVLFRGETVKRTLILVSADPNFAPELEPTTESFVHASLFSSASGHTLSIEIAPDAPLGVINTSVIVRTGLEREPELEIPITTFVSAKIAERQHRSIPY